MKLVDMNIENLTLENVWDLSEEDVFNMLQYIQVNLPKEEQLPFIKIIDTAFEFRSISSKRRDMRQSLALLGFKFFKPVNDNSSTMITGVYKRKSPNKSFY